MNWPFFCNYMEQNNGYGKQVNNESRMTHIVTIHNVYSTYTVSGEANFAMSHTGLTIGGFTQPRT